MKPVQKLFILIFSLLLTAPQSTATPTAPQLGIVTAANLLLTLKTMHHNYLKECKAMTQEAKEIKKQGFVKFCINFRKQPNCAKRYPKTVALLALNSGLATATIIKLYLENQAKKTQENTPSTQQTLINEETAERNDIANLYEKQQEGQKLIIDAFMQSKEKLETEIQEKTKKRIFAATVLKRLESVKDSKELKEIHLELQEKRDKYHEVLYADNTVRQRLINLQMNRYVDYNENFCRLCREDTNNKQTENEIEEALEATSQKFFCEKLNLLLPEGYQADNYMQIQSHLTKILNYERDLEFNTTTFKKMQPGGELANLYNPYEKERELAALEDFQQIPKILNVFLDLAEKTMLIAEALTNKDKLQQATDCIADIKKFQQELPQITSIETIKNHLPAFNKIADTIKYLTLFIKRLKPQ